MGFLVSQIAIALACASMMLAAPVDPTDGVSPPWLGKQADIFFLLDTSASVWVRDFSKMANFVATMVSKMDIGISKTRVGLGVYEEEFHPYLHIDSETSKDQLVDDIKRAPYKVGNGHLSVGIQGVRKALSREVRRKGVPSIGVVFTDGRSRYKQLALSNATLAKEEGIFLFMIGVGSEVDTLELYNMASDPKAMYYHYVHSFDNLDSIQRKLMNSMAEVEYFQGDAGTCGDTKQVDTVFVYDEFSLGRSLAQQMTRLILNASDRFSMGTGNVRLAAISTSPRETDFMLGHYVRREKLQEMLHSRIEDSTPLADLVVRATTEALLDKNGARPGSLRRLVLVLDREITMANRNLLTAVLRAKFDGIQVFVIQLGARYDKRLVTMLSTKKEWAFFDTSLETLLDKKSAFFSKFCEGLTRYTSSGSGQTSGGSMSGDTNSLTDTTSNKKTNNAAAPAQLDPPSSLALLLCLFTTLWSLLNTLQRPSQVDT